MPLLEELAPDMRAALTVTPGARLHFAQFAEDAILIELLQTHKLITAGFYVDVGAHHPTKHSNTHQLRALQGWRGINIDADREAVAAFDTACPDCHNILAAISDEEREVTFTKFDQSGMNTIDEALADRRDVTGRELMRTQTLTSILDGLAPLPKIALLSVDVEGHDLQVLKSLDWARYRPFAICIEDIGMQLGRPGESEIFGFLTSLGYILMSHTWITSLYFHPSESGWRPPGDEK